MDYRTASDRCLWHSCAMALVRSEVMWQAVVEAVQLASGAPLDVLDLGGGTGIDAVRLAAEGHRVTVVDPSADALASLGRRATESGVAESVHAVQGDSTDLMEHVQPRSTDLVLCHGVLEYLENPGEALVQVARVLRRGGIVSAVVPGRLGAVLSRAVAGDFQAAETLLVSTAAEWNLRADGPRRYTAAELNALAREPGLRPVMERGVRVFADLVPASVVDAQPRGRDALFALERLAGDEFKQVAAGLQLIARLEWGQEPNRGEDRATI